MDEGTGGATEGTDGVTEGTDGVTEGTEGATEGTADGTETAGVCSITKGRETTGGITGFGRMG